MCPSDHGLNFRVNVGDLIEYGWGKTTIHGLVLQVVSIKEMNAWGGTNAPQFTMKLLELDSTISVWDVWRSDKIVILNETRGLSKNSVF